MAKSSLVESYIKLIIISLIMTHNNTVRRTYIFLSSHQRVNVNKKIKTIQRNATQKQEKNKMKDAKIFRQILFFICILVLLRYNNTYAHIHATCMYTLIMYACMHQWKYCFETIYT